MEKGNDASQPLNKNQGENLVLWARHTILEKLGRHVDKTISDALSIRLSDVIFQTQAGTFVTLKIDGQLRGCIGSLTSTDSLVESVKQNAINAALHDPRFPPLSSREIDRVQVEVSVLTEPTPLEYIDARDLIRQLRVNIDGVIIRKGFASATFLPQVWEQLPDPEQFLSHLCMKAGLPGDAWGKKGLEVMVYKAQYFGEDK